MSSKTKSKKFVYKEGTTKKHEVINEAMKYLAKDSYEYLQFGKHSWLVNHKGVTYREISEDYYKNRAKRLQNTRKLWMQSMYEEYKAKNE